MSKRKIRIGVKQLLIIIVVLLTVFIGFGEESPLREKAEIYNQPLSDSENINVHFIDVGQGSSVLIQQGSQGILIDSGEDDYGETLCNYISSVGVTEIPYMIATHPHSDHIGGLDEVLYEYTVSTVVMPEIKTSYQPDSKVYEDFIGAVQNENAEIIYPSYGEKIIFGEDMTISFLGPVEQVSDLNNMSLICKISAFSTTFMVMGDAERKEMDSVYEAGGDFDSDVIFVPHHGSNTSLHDDFLYEVSPEVAVISCGEDNSYGHPHEEVLEYYENSGCKIYRTDIEDNIVVVCNKDGYTVE